MAVSREIRGVRHSGEMKDPIANKDFVDADLALFPSIYLASLPIVWGYRVRVAGI
jgi:hypothetical protein